MGSALLYNHVLACAPRQVARRSSWSGCPASLRLQALQALSSFNPLPTPLALHAGIHNKNLSPPANILSAFCYASLHAGGQS